MGNSNVSRLADRSGRGEGRKLRVSVGHRHLGRAKNKTWYWEDLVERLAEPVRSKETLREYLKLPKADQDKLKNVGFFVCGHCDGGVRSKNTIQERDLIALDMDEASADLISEIELGMSRLADYEFYSYSTRKHTPDNPRIRIVLPLVHGVTAEEHHALSRIVASMIDETMDMTDPVSFRMAQVMYFPSACYDGEFFAHHNPGKWLNPTEVLGDFGDWQDHTKLPYSELRGEAKALVSKKVEDPTEKRGIVGAFCRVYDVEAAIEKFIPEVYAPGDTGRYSYLAGSTSNGAILYDDGNILYSNHSTDPAGERSQNSFDLVRIHKFGHLDDDSKDIPATQTASFKEMQDFLSTDKDVQMELRKNHIPEVDESDFDAFEDEDDPLAEEPDSKDWVESLEVSKDGEILKTLDNILVILQNDPRLKGTAKRNLFRNEVAACRRLDDIQVENARDGDMWSDRHDNRIRHILEKPVSKGGYGLGPVSRLDLKAAIDLSSSRHSYHPVRDYLSKLRWDGQKRLDSLFVRYLGAEDNTYVRAVCRKFFSAAVARVFKPGVKFDQAVILEGAQGIRKSSMVRVLSRGWCSDLESGFEDSKKFVENSRDSWFFEVGELKGFTRVEVAALKDFFSRTSDTCRLAYATHGAEYPRQCVFIMTTNEAQYLRDLTGNRRFWPVKCATDWIDLESLEQEIDQVWAEAVAVWEAGEALWLEDEAVRQFAEQQQAVRVQETDEDVLFGQVEEWLSQPADARRYEDELDEDFEDLIGEDLIKRDRVCLAEIWVDCLGRPEDRYDAKAARILGSVMTRMPGWRRHEGSSLRFGKRFGKQKAFVREEV